MTQETDPAMQVQRPAQKKALEKPGSETITSKSETANPVTRESFDSQGQQPMPARTQSELPESGMARPTPDNYLAENPTVPPFIKHNKRRATQFERNALCRYVGGTGIYFAHKHRSWCMGCSAFISFVCLILMIVPLLSTVKSPPDITKAFCLANGEAHWTLIIPVDWTERIYLGLGGMVNQTQKGSTYYVPYTSKECTEVFGTTCSNCQDASLTVVVLLAIAIATVVPAMCLDVHRLFVFFDYNLSKVLALILHLVFGVICTVLAYITFLNKCFMAMPSYTVHQGTGRRPVGINLVWQLSATSMIMLILLILRPIPGILHLITPTPSWANNKGIKAARNKKKDKVDMLDPFDDLANGLMPGGNEEVVFTDVTKPSNNAEPAYAIPIRTQSEFVEATPARPITDKDADTVSEATEPVYGEMVSNFGAAPTMVPTLIARPAETRRDSVLSAPTGEGSIPVSPRVRSREDSFVDPFAEHGASVKRDDPEPAGKATPSTLPAEAGMETKPVSKK
eukprot:GGOE01025544.1.p1 GENE.GGOE01025544.1~~GGOE01025544.1.p1  ORF type:complete len:511 (+),score=67.81 GGOE01025544.1:45-1577(+)